ncbi:MAG: DNA-3-methyladenine glycosylase [Akkermansiaceae bacterium]|nr:DNA-3-methyladenine glycosylase [Akkermansiaceae bacterium]MCP5551956.1 DNA-3-methyladenine glycosylase [Akkermansiaceae bacterium]
MKTGGPNRVGSGAQPCWVGASGPPLGRDFFEREAVACARELVGAVFRRGDCAGIVVETEAYSEHGDEACHTFFRPSARRFVEEHDAGAAYVYFNYGMYWLTNVLIKNPRTGERGFVLLRALEPVAGLDLMRRRRGRENPRDLCSGPGKLSMAFGLDGADHGKSFVASAEHGFFPSPETSRLEVVADRRVGISRSRNHAWRFLAAGNPHVSVKFGRVK